MKALDAEGYSCPTSIQAQAIPHVLAGGDLLGCAQTGTGKTAAFALPLLELLHRAPEKQRKLRVLVLAPTRELACQIDASFRVYGRNTKLRSVCIYGGVSQKPQATMLARGVDIVVATPGRLHDLIGQRLIDLRHVQRFVLDEADRMLDMGFIADVRKLLPLLPPARQTLMFSATLAPEVRQLASAMLTNAAVVQVAPQSTVAPTIDQTVYFVEKPHKRNLLVRLLGHEAMSRALVFTKTKRSADRLHQELRKAGIRAEAIHGDKSQATRERILGSFRSENLPVLVATDVASRGLDVDRVSHVFNYDMPLEPETYIHRIGRTGRAGLSGIAVSFCCVEERSQLRAVERLIKQSIAVVPLHIAGEPRANEIRANLPRAQESSDGQAAARDRKRPNRASGGRRKFIRGAGSQKASGSQPAAGGQPSSGSQPSAGAAGRPGNQPASDSNRPGAAQQAAAGAKKFGKNAARRKRRRRIVVGT